MRKCALQIQDLDRLYYLPYTFPPTKISTLCPRSVVKEKEPPPSCQNSPTPAAISASRAISDESQTTVFEAFTVIFLPRTRVNKAQERTYS